MASTNLTDRAFASICRGLGLQFEDGEFCDICVVVGPREFSCHRLVLASVSTYFKISLKPSWREGSSGRVEITHEDVSPESFEFLMDIIYRGKDVVTNDTAKDILRMSIYLQIPFLTEYCVEFLQKNLQHEFCLGTWQFSQKYDLATLAETSFKMAVDEICSVSKHDELLALPKSMLLILLSLQNKLAMDDVCKTVLRWVEADQDVRQIHLLELLPFVAFPQLTPQYICDLSASLNLQLREILFEKISEGVTYVIKGVLKNDSTVRTQILARQSVPLSLPEIKTRAVMFGGYTEVDKPIKDTYAFDSQNKIMKRYSLTPLPEDIGIDFASCTWSNEIYVSGGSQLPTYFAVYQPGDNKWEVLPSVPGEGREKHAMAAVSSEIFVLGGLEKNAQRKSGHDVLKYNLKIEKWGVFCQLPLGVQEATAAVLGHRIYLFGGVDADGQTTDLVQCVDTLSGCAYQAGKLPSPTCGARALSNGGLIHVLCPEGTVLSMWESFALAEQREKAMAANKEKEAVDEVSVDTIKSTVSFKEVGKFTARRHFGAYLQSGEITVCGGESDEKELLYSFEAISLPNGKTEKKYMALISGAAKFDLYILNVPPASFREDIAVKQPFRVGDTVMLLQHELNRLHSQNRYQGQIPYGTGTITAAVGNSITVEFPSVHGWTGYSRQVQHAP